MVYYRETCISCNFANLLQNKEKAVISGSIVILRHFLENVIYLENEIEFYSFV